MNLNYISKKAIMGENVQIGRFCVIEDDVFLADHVIVEDHAIIQQGAKVGEGTIIGTYCKVGKDTVIGSNCKFTSYCEIRDNCVLGDNVSMGSRCTLSANITVEDDVIIKYGFVATDTPKLSQNDVKVTGVLGKGSKYGANVTIMPGLSIGANVEIGSCSQVRHNVPDNEIWYGNPARFYKKNSQ